ncbi:hypothetical protein [Novosphingopyxis sp.]|uniref:hypothetical protein n=1 Tax=Novosphingopyxis sp. TaxID=2709690 RepID=UPI003B5BD8E9
MQRALTCRLTGDTAALLARIIVLVALILVPATARAKSAAAVGSDVYVEQSELRTDGSRQIRLEPAATPRTGDSLVFRLRYTPTAAAGRTMLTSAVPDSVSFIGGGDLVSVDGGRHWGRLDELSVRDAEGRARRALPEDVTHVRWIVGETRQRPNLLFRGRVR